MCTRQSPSRTHFLCHSISSVVVCNPKISRSLIHWYWGRNFSFKSIKSKWFDCRDYGSITLAWEKNLMKKIVRSVTHYCLRSMERPEKHLHNPKTKKERLIHMTIEGAVIAYSSFVTADIWSYENLKKQKNFSFSKSGQIVWENQLVWIVPLVLTQTVWVNSSKGTIVLRVSRDFFLSSSNLIQKLNKDWNL